MKKEKPNYPIKVLDKSLSVLELLLQKGSSMNMIELSEKLGFYPSTTHRILDTLKHRGYVEQNSHTQKYQLGLKALELGMAKLHQMDLVREATPCLKELVNQCNETVFSNYKDDLLRGQKSPPSLYCFREGAISLSFRGRKKENIRGKSASSLYRKYHY